MSEKRSFAPVPDFMAEMAAKTPGGKPIEPVQEQVSPVAPVPTPAPVPASPAAVTAPTPAPAPMAYVPEAQPFFREKEATQKMTVNMPKDLYESLRAYMKITDTPMSDLIIEGARQELVRRKTREGIK